VIEMSGFEGGTFSFFEDKSRAVSSAKEEISRISLVIKIPMEVSNRLAVMGSQGWGIFLNLSRTKIKI
jgi:hypothetical protein